MPRPKPPSGRRSGSGNPSPPELLCDRGLGRWKVPERLRKLHHSVIAHDDLFSPDTADATWLRAAGNARWIVLMKEDRVRYRADERKVIVETGVPCFCLHPSKGMTGDHMAEALATALPRILAIVAANPEGGYIMGVNRFGRVRHLFP